MLSSSLVPFRVIKEYRPAKYLVENHEHPYFHLLSVVSGKLLVVCRDARVQVGADDVLLVPPHSMHMIYATESTRSIELKFSCENELESLSRTFETRSSWLWSADKKVCAGIASILTEAESKQPHYIEIISARIYELLMQLLRSLRVASLEVSETAALPELQLADASDNSLINGAVAYIDSHLTEKLSVGDIAKRLGYTSSYFSAAFKRSVGITPQQFITLRKIDLAKDLIRRDQLSLSAISDELKFSSAPAFTNTFKKCCGITPSHYAQHARDCTYINLIETSDLPSDNVRYIEPVFRENIASLLRPKKDAPSQPVPVS